MSHFARFQIVSGYDPRTAVPAQDRVVITGRPHFFSRRETVHGLPEQLISTHAPFGQHRLGTTFVHDASVIGPFIIAVYAHQVFGDPGVADGIVLTKAVAHGKY